VSIRIIHHWACSGGTIIARSIATLQNVVILSEVHPLAYLRLSNPETTYTPTDIIQQLCLPHNGADPALCVAAWRGAIASLEKKVAANNKVLVLRNHSHVDFFTGAQPETEHFIARILKDTHAITELLTVRHPLDSWMSMKLQNWDRHFRYSTFEEFCNRAIALVQASQGLPIVRYEEFTINPTKGLEIICKLLAIEFERQHSRVLDTVSLSGDSGRSSNQIKVRSRRVIPEEIKSELEKMHKHQQASSYHQLCVMLGYDPDPSAPPPFLWRGIQPTAIIPIAD
jgi:hypothetical protein